MNSKNKDSQKDQTEKLLGYLVLLTIVIIWFSLILIAGSLSLESYRSEGRFQVMMLHQRIQSKALTDIATELTEIRRHSGRPDS